MIQDHSLVFVSQVMAYLGQIQDPWDSQVFTVAHIVIGLSLHIHSSIHIYTDQLNAGHANECSEGLWISLYHISKEQKLIIILLFLKLHFKIYSTDQSCGEQKRLSVPLPPPW